MDKITREALLSLGFTELFNRKHRYEYHGFTGRLDGNTFYFHGFNPPITTITDIKYMRMVIDYHRESEVTPFPSHMN